MSIFSEKLPLMEAFYTLQGEGFHQGKAAFFIRLGGCDVGCHWCDVKESWEANAHPKTDLEQIVSLARQNPARLAVVTGGEPLMYALENLTQSLKKAGFQTNLETSGAYPLTGVWDWICFSPKKFKQPRPEFYAYADELKVIIFHESDFAWAENFAQKMRADCQLFLQVEWSKTQKLLPKVVEYVQKNPHWRISLQTHKYMNIP